MDTSAGEISVVERLNRFVHGCKQNTLMYTTTLTTALHTTHAGKMGRKIAKDETHTHPFNGPFFWDYPGQPVPEKKTNLDFTEARDSEWQ